MWLHASLLIVDDETDEPPEPEFEPDPLELDPLELELDPELLGPELELPELDPPEDDPLELEPLDPLPLLDTSFTTLTPLPFPCVVLFPSPSPASLLADILDKSENIGLSLLVIPYAATAAAIHKTIIIEIIIFALSNIFPPIKFIQIE